MAISNDAPRGQSGTSTAVVNALVSAGIELAENESIFPRPARLEPPTLLRYRAKFLTVAWRSILLPAQMLHLDRKRIKRP